jgi:hypothetical protein
MNAAQLQGQAILMAGLIELVLVLLSVLMVVSWRGAGRGTLRNAYVGMRLPSTMRSPQAWAAANRVGYCWAPVYVLFNVIMGVCLFAAAPHGWRLAVAFIGGGGFFILIGLICGTAFFANRATHAVTAPADRASPPSAVGSPNRVPRLTERQLGIVRWLFAVAACAATGALLGQLIDGYVLALHHQLQPADRFGARDDTMMSCWPRWYASQIGFFQWMLFGCGPVLVAAMGLYVGAAIQHRRPWDIWALVLGTVFVMLPFLIAAVIHADRVAGAITC